MGYRMKIFPVVIFIVLLSASSAFAQFWAKTYGEEQTEVTHQVLQTNDGGFILTGGRSYHVSDTETILLKLNSEGNIQWQKKYESSYSDLIRSLQQTSDGGYIASVSVAQERTKPEVYLSVLRLDSNGNILWQKQLYYTRHAPWSDIKETTDGFILTSTDEDGRIWVVKLDPQGNPVWDKRYGSAGESYTAHTIEQTDDDNDGMRDDGFILAAHHSYNNPDVTYPLILKLDRFGNISWQKEYILPSYYIFAIDHFHQTMDGSYIGAGWADEELSGFLDFDIIVFKCDESGEVVWHKIYKTEYGGVAKDIIETSSNEYVLIGHIIPEVALIKLDSNGNDIWQKIIKGVKYGHSVQETTGGGFVIGADTSSWPSRDMIVLKLDANGEIPLCSIITPADAIATQTTFEVSPAYLGVKTGQTSIRTPNYTVETYGAESKDVCPPETDMAVWLLDDPDPVSLYGNLYYSVIISNNGPTTVTGVSLVDDLPVEVNFISVVPNDICSETAGRITCNIGDLQSGAEFEAAILVAPQQTGIISNTVTVSGNEFMPIVRNALTSVCHLDLSITTQDIPDPVREGYYFSYIHTVTNNGYLTANNVTLSDNLPPDAEFISAKSNVGQCSDPIDNEIVCELGDLAGQQAAVVNILLRSLNKGVLYNIASVDRTQQDCLKENDISYSDTAVRSFIVNTVDHGCCPSMDLDTAENVHLSYTREEGFRHATNEADRWQKTTVGANANEAAPTSAVAIDSSDNVYVCFGENSWSLSNPRLTCRERVDGTWQSSVTPVSGGPGFWPISMDMDSQDNLHISYNESFPGTMDGKLYYLSNASGSWGSPMDLGDAYDHVALKTDADNNVHLSYYKIGQGLLYRTNAPDGIWQSPETVDPLWHCGQCEGMVTDIDIFTDNRPHISYAGAVQEFGNEDIKYAFRDGGGNWIIENLAAGDFSSAGNAVCVDPDGHTHISYYHKPSEELRYASNSDGSWQQETIDGGIFQWWKWNNDIAVDSKGFVHIAYDNANEVKHASKLILQDNDYDGVADFREMGLDGTDPGYDGNSDGEADSGQENVTSLPTHDDAEYVTLVSPDGTMLADVDAEENPSPSDSPADQEFPVGFFEFTIYGIEPGGSTVVTLILPDGMTIDTYYKFGPTPENPTPHWYEFSYDSQTQTGAVINGSQIVLHLVDGQRGDHDITVNGVIVEPGSPAMEKSDTCEHDSDADGDVDGTDLAAFITSGATDVALFAEDFGKIDCPCKGI